MEENSKILLLKPLINYKIVIRINSLVTHLPLDTTLSVKHLVVEYFVWIAFLVASTYFTFLVIITSMLQKRNMTLSYHDPTFIVCCVIFVTGMSIIFYGQLFCPHFIFCRLVDTLSYKFLVLSQNITQQSMNQIHSQTTECIHTYKHIFSTFSYFLCFNSFLKLAFLISLSYFSTRNLGAQTVL